MAELRVDWYDRFPDSLEAAILVRSLAAALLLTAAAMHGPVAAEPGQIVVFVQPDTPLGAAFERDHLPALRDLAEDLKIPLRTHDVRNGAPDVASLTPLLTFQNFRGRSIFQGRFTDLGRVETFVRTSRFVPQGQADFTRGATPLARIGRMQIATPLKIVDPGGTPPEPYDPERFRMETEAALVRGMADFHLRETIALGRGDRLFYLDLYPWVGKDGSLHLSVALFSQFHCKEPLYETGDEPLIGSWESRDDLFRRAGEVLRAEIARQMARPELGDGFDPVPDSVPVRSWEDLGFGLPAEPPGDSVDVTGLTLPAAWNLAPATEDRPPSIQFRFPPPIDHYRGTVPGVTAELAFDPPGGFGSVNGWVEADVHTLTMGTDELNQEIRGKTFLNADRFPTARFRFDTIRSDRDGLEFGHLTQVTLTGLFHMRGVDMPLTLEAQLEPIVTAEREIRLLLDGEFQINLKRPFGMLAADGPSPQNETVLVDVRLALAPAAELGAR